jgi:putative addiction module killer protein
MLSRPSPFVIEKPPQPVGLDAPRRRAAHASSIAADVQHKAKYNPKAGYRHIVSETGLDDAGAFSSSPRRASCFRRRRSQSSDKPIPTCRTGGPPRGALDASVYCGIHTSMLEIQQSDAFAKWLGALRDREARIRILGRIARLAQGNPGDVEPVGDGVSEMRIHFGPGYRVYFVRRGLYVAILLGGGSKRTQQRDIRAAKALAALLEKDS